MALSSTNLLPLSLATNCAIVVFPVPGGPHKMTETVEDFSPGIAFVAKA
jgi:hypothetical protein